MSNWRDNPEIIAAQSYAHTFGKRRVIIWSEDDDGCVGGVSYGANGNLCKLAGRAMEEAFAFVEKALWDTAPD